MPDALSALTLRARVERAQRYYTDFTGRVWVGQGDANTGICRLKTGLPFGGFVEKPAPGGDVGILCRMLDSDAG